MNLTTDKNYIAAACKNNLEVGNVSLASVEMALGLPEIRELIVSQLDKTDYSLIHEKQSILSLRLVSKQWLTSVSRALRKQGKPLFILHYRGSSKLNETPFEPQSLKHRENFVNVICSAKWNQDCVPPYRLWIWEAESIPGNCEILETLLTKYNKGLVDLELFSDSTINMQMYNLLPQLVFPFLSTLKVSHDFSQQVINSTNHTEIVTIINALLNSSNPIQRFSFFDKSKTFEEIKLPATIRTLDLHVEWSPKEIQNLAQTNLPDIRILSLKLFDVSIHKNALFQVFHNFRKSLSFVRLFGESYALLNSKPVVCQFPVMENLRQLILDGYNLQFDTDHEKNSDESCFPKLRSLELMQSHLGLSLWAQKAKCNSVDTLKLSWASTYSFEPSGLEVRNPKYMQLVHSAFPNITVLTVHLSGRDKTEFEYLFKNMTQLKSLEIKVWGMRAMKNANFWDSLLTGKKSCSVQKLNKTVNEKDIPTNFDLTNKTDFDGGIRNLMELHTLHLYDNSRMSLQDPALEPLISDLAFTCAFLQMPKLTCLAFSGRFKASSESKNKWVELGRCIK